MYSHHSSVDAVNFDFVLSAEVQIVYSLLSSKLTAILVKLGLVNCSSYSLTP